MNDKVNKWRSDGATVLVVEKEPIARRSLSSLLREAGYGVLEAADSQAALNRMNGHPEIAVILADLDMASWPLVVDHARMTLPKASVLVMAGYGLMASVVDAQKHGARGYFLKPLVFADLHRAMIDLLKQPVSA